MLLEVALERASDKFHVLLCKQFVEFVKGKPMVHQGSPWILLYRDSIVAVLRERRSCYDKKRCHSNN